MVYNYFFYFQDFFLRSRLFILIIVVKKIYPLFLAVDNIIDPPFCYTYNLITSHKDEANLGYLLLNWFPYSLIMTEAKLYRLAVAQGQIQLT